MLALTIFAVTLILVIWQPKGLGIGWSALGGALMALALGVVQWSDVGLVWDIVWDATFTFVGLIIISLILDAAGFFSWAALHVARWGNGRGQLLFPLVVVLGAIIAAYMLGLEDVFLEELERAHQLHARDADVLSAARTAFCGSPRPAASWNGACSRACRTVWTGWTGSWITATRMAPSRRRPPN